MGHIEYRDEECDIGFDGHCIGKETMRILQFTCDQCGSVGRRYCSRKELDLVVILPDQWTNLGIRCQRRDDSLFLCSDTCLLRWVTGFIYTITDRATARNVTHDALANG